MAEQNTVTEPNSLSIAQAFDRCLHFTNLSFESGDIVKICEFTDSGYYKIYLKSDNEITIIEVLNKTILTVENISNSSSNSDYIQAEVNQTKKDGVSHFILYFTGSDINAVGIEYTSGNLKVFLTDDNNFDFSVSSVFPKNKKTYISENSFLGQIRTEELKANEISTTTASINFIKIGGWYISPISENNNTSMINIKYVKQETDSNG